EIWQRRAKSVANRRRQAACAASPCLWHVAKRPLLAALSLGWLQRRRARPESARRRDFACRRRRPRLLQPPLRFADADQRPARRASVPRRLLSIHLRRFDRPL